MSDESMRPEVRAALEDLFGDSTPNFDGDHEEEEVPSCCKGHLVAYLLDKLKTQESVPPDQMPALKAAMRKHGAPEAVIDGLMLAFTDPEALLAAEITVNEKGAKLGFNGQTVEMPPPVALFFAAQVLHHIRDNKRMKAVLRDMVKAIAEAK